jgi:hypothetical protein
MQSMDVEHVTLTIERYLPSPIRWAIADGCEAFSWLSRNYLPDCLFSVFLSKPKIVVNMEAAKAGKHLVE